MIICLKTEIVHFVINDRFQEKRTLWCSSSLSADPVGPSENTPALAFPPPISFSHLLTMLHEITSWINYLYPIPHSECALENSDHNSMSSHSPHATHMLTSPCRETSVSDTPFLCCPLMPIQTYVHIFRHSLGLAGRTVPGLSPCLSSSSLLTPVLDVSDKVLCQHCKLLVGSYHLLFLVTISLFNCLIRYKSAPMILSESARKKSTLELTWWPMAPLSPQMTNAGNKDTRTDKHD